VCRSQWLLLQFGGLLNCVIIDKADRSIKCLSVCAEFCNYTVLETLCFVYRKSPTSELCASASDLFLISTLIGVNTEARLLHTRVGSVCSKRRVSYIVAEFNVRFRQWIYFKWKLQVPSDINERSCEYGNGNLF